MGTALALSGQQLPMSLTTEKFDVSVLRVMNFRLLHIIQIWDLSNLLSSGYQGLFPKG
jgi:hypothetical protein